MEWIFLIPRSLFQCWKCEPLEDQRGQFGGQVFAVGHHRPEWRSDSKIADFILVAGYI